VTDGGAPKCSITVNSRRARTLSSEIRALRVVDVDAFRPPLVEEAALGRLLLSSHVPLQLQVQLQVEVGQERRPYRDISPTAKGSAGV